MKNFPTPDEYNAFVAGIELDRVRVVKCDAEAHHAEIDFKDVVFRVEENVRFETHPRGFEAMSTYTLRVTRRDQDEVCCGTVTATFGLRFSSNVPTTEGLLDVFRHVNLPMNTWPYWREFAQSTATRLGWPAITAPLLKSNASEERAEDDAKPAKPLKSRSAKPIKR
jgi:hypothetical protein